MKYVELNIKPNGPTVSCSLLVQLIRRWRTLKETVIRHFGAATISKHRSITNRTTVACNDNLEFDYYIWPPQFLFLINWFRKPFYEKSVKQLTKAVISGYVSICQGRCNYTVSTHFEAAAILKICCIATRTKTSCTKNFSTI